MTGRRCREVVHFDRLKPCVPGTRFDASPSDPEPPTVHSSTSSTQPTSNTTPTHQLEIVDDAERDIPLPRAHLATPPPRRYPSRIHRESDRFPGYISH